MKFIKLVDENRKKRNDEDKAQLEDHINSFTLKDSETEHDTAPEKVGKRIFNDGLPKWGSKNLAMFTSQTSQVSSEEKENEPEAHQRPTTNTLFVSSNRTIAKSMTVDIGTENP